MPSKYAITSKCVMMKKCIMTSHVHPSERGSVISDCLVLLFVAFFRFSMSIHLLFTIASLHLISLLYRLYLLLVMNQYIYILAGLPGFAQVSMKGVLVESVRNVEVISMTVKIMMPAKNLIPKLIIISKCYICH